MVNGAALDNFSPEKLDLYKHIANAVITNMSDAYKDTTFYTSADLLKNDAHFMSHIRQLSFIYKKLQSQILNSAYDNGQTAALILTTANFAESFLQLDRTLEDGPEKVAKAKALLQNSFHISLSHASVFKTFVTTLAAINTKIGVRRKGSGAQNVQTTHESFMRFVTVPTLEDKMHKEESFYVNNDDFK